MSLSATLCYCSQSVGTEEDGVRRGSRLVSDSRRRRLRAKQQADSEGNREGGGGREGKEMSSGGGVRTEESGSVVMGKRSPL